MRTWQGKERASPRGTRADTTTRTCLCICPTDGWGASRLQLKHMSLQILQPIHKDQQAAGKAFLAPRQTLPTPIPAEYEQRSEQKATGGWRKCPRPPEWAGCPETRTHPQDEVLSSSVTFSLSSEKTISSEAGHRTHSMAKGTTGEQQEESHRI